MEDTRYRVAPRERPLPEGGATLRTGFEDGSCAYAEVFRIALGPRFQAAFDAELGGWDQVVDLRFGYWMLAYFLVVSAIGGVAGFAVGGWLTALGWALLVHPPVGVVAVSFLLFYGLVFQRPSEEPVQTDAVGVRVGRRRWAWEEIAAVHGGNTLLAGRAKLRIIRRPGLVLELTDGTAVGWQVEPGSGDLLALTERLEAMRHERTADAPAEKAAVERLGRNG